MAVVEKSRVEREIVVMHDDEVVKLLNFTSEIQVEQIGSQMMVEEVGFSLVQKEAKSALSTPQNDEVSQVLETALNEASPQGVLKSEAPVFEKALPVVIPQGETRFVEEFGIVKPAGNMRSESEIDAMEERGSNYVQTENVESKYEECCRIERKFTCSEEASVDVHSEDSEKRDTAKDILKAVNVVHHALPLQKNSEEFAGVAGEAELEPTSAAKWIHEVSIDVFIPDEWVEKEMSSVMEPEASTGGIAPSLASEKPPLGVVGVEHANLGLIEGPSAIGATELEKQGALQVFEKGTDVIEFEKQGRELISQSLGTEEPITETEREITFEESKIMNLPEQALPDSVEWNSGPSNECEMTNQELQVLPSQVAEASKNFVPTSTEDEDVCCEGSLPLPSGEIIQVAEASKNFVPTSTEGEDVGCEGSLPLPSGEIIQVAEASKNFVPTSTEDENVGCEGSLPLPSGEIIQVAEASKNFVPTSAEDEGIGCKGSLPFLSGEVSEPMVWEFAPTQVETINVAETSPCTSESPVLAEVELTCQRTTDVDSNQDERHVKSAERVLSFTDWGRVAEVDASTTETMIEELESTSAASKPSEVSADIGEQVQCIWSLKNLERRPYTVGPKTSTEQAIPPVKPKAPKVVGLAWPPKPLITTEDNHYVHTDDTASPRQREADCVGATDTIVAELKEELLEFECSPSEQFEGAMDGAEADTEAQNLQRLWSLKNLKKRPLTVEPRTSTEQGTRPPKLKAPKVVGLAWPPKPLIIAEDNHYVHNNDTASPRQREADCAGATDTIIAEPKEELLESPSEQFEGTMNGAEAGIGDQVQSIWNLKNLERRPYTVEPKTSTEQAIRPVKPKAPKVVGLAWPPKPLITAEGNHYVHTNGTASPRQREAGCVGAMDTIVAESKDELLEFECSPSEQFEGAMDGAEADTEAQNLQRLWSLKYLQTRPVMVGPSTAAQQTPKLVKLEAPKVVGMSWPPAPAMDRAEADTKCSKIEPMMVGAGTAAQPTPKPVKLKAPKVVGLSWPPLPAMDGAEADIKAQFLNIRPVMIEARTAVQKTPELVKLKAPKAVGLSWPPAPLMAAPAIM